MFVTNPYIAIRGISVPMDVALPWTPVLVQGGGCYQSSVSRCLPLVPPARAPPCPALPSLAGARSGFPAGRALFLPSGWAVPVRPQPRGGACSAEGGRLLGAAAGPGCACPLPLGKRSRAAHKRESRTLAWCNSVLSALYMKKLASGIGQGWYPW